MLFTESGLPNDKSIKEAFDYSRTFTMKNRKMALKDFNQQMDAIHEGLIADLDKDRANMPEVEYKRNKEALERMHDEQLKQGPMLVEQALDAMFVARRVKPALEILKNSEDPSPDLVAATLLCECIRSPKDFQAVTDKFGPHVAGIAAEITHIDAYPGEREESLKEASVDAKRVYLAWLCGTTANIAEQIENAAKQTPPQKLSLPPGHEKQLYSDVQPLWGTDKKLEARFLDAFNRTCEGAGSPFRLEADDKGGINLVQGGVAAASKDGTKPKPPGPSSPNIGGDVF